jgi:hypothetical protein
MTFGPKDRLEALMRVNTYRELCTVYPCARVSDDRGEAPVNRDGDWLLRPSDLVHVECDPFGTWNGHVTISDWRLRLPEWPAFLGGHSWSWVPDEEAA